MLDISSIPLDYYPLITFTHNFRSPIGKGIQLRTNSLVSHVMESHRPGFFATQDFTGFKTLPFDKVDNKHTYFLFYRYEGLTEKKQEEWWKTIYRDLDEPWWLRRYDWLGVVGQLFGVRWLESPFTEYCSQKVKQHLFEVFGSEIKKRPTPEELRKYCRKYPQWVEVGEIIPEGYEDVIKRHKKRLDGSILGVS